MHNFQGCLPLKLTAASIYGLEMYISNDTLNFVMSQAKS